MAGVRDIFDDISIKLNGLTNKRGEKVFKTVDLNRGQMQQLKGFENIGQLITFPAIFFKPEEIKNLPRTGNVYVTEMRIRIHVVLSQLVYEDPLEIFDLPMLVDRAILDGKYESINLVSMRKGFEVMPETFDNTQIYELNYWCKYWNTNAYIYRDWVDANDPEVNPEAPIELNLDAYIDDDEDYS